MKKFTILEIFLFVTLFGCLGVGKFLSSEANRAAFGSHGGIFEGEKFGVSVGSETSEAINILKNNGYHTYLQVPFHSSKKRIVLTRKEIQANGYCMGYKITEDQTFELFYDNSWRQGSICIVSKDGIVDRILWYFDWMQS